jgi:SAM-dependent methyltransferase
MSPPAARPDEIGAPSAPASVENGNSAQEAAAEDYRSPLQDLIDRSDFHILQRILPSTPGWFVEIGSGWGRLLPAYYRPDRDIVLVDSHREILETARERHPLGNIHFVCADAGRLPFRADVFSAGLCVRAFQELAAPEAFLRELGRVLGPETRFVLSYANKRNLLRLLRHGRGFRRDHEAAGERMFVTHPRYLEQLLPPAGLSRQRAHGSGLVEQLLRPGRLYALARALPFLLPLFALADRVLNFALGPLGLLPHTFAVLRKESLDVPAATPPATTDPRSLAAILACPACRAFPLTPDSASDSFLCSSCARRFPRTNGVWDFTVPPSGQ